MIYKLFIFLFRRQRSTRFHGIFAVWIDGTKILWYNKRRNKTIHREDCII